jgi:hypothetical protein
MFLPAPRKLRKEGTAARCLLVHAELHGRHVPAGAVHSFTGLGNSTNMDVVHARLWLRELSNELSRLNNVHAVCSATRQGGLAEGNPGSA